MKQFLAILTLLAAQALSGWASGWAADGPQAITFELLGKTNYSNTPPPAFPAPLRKLEGRRVRLSGFVLPYDDPEKLTKLMLVNTPGGCYFCSPPLPNAVVFVRRSAADPPLKYSPKPVGFEGTLHLWRDDMKKDDEARGFFFTLDEARVLADGSPKTDRRPR